MRSYLEYIEDHHPREDGRGGYLPPKSKMATYKNADLITLPPDVEGTNCGNCKFFNDGFCEHTEVHEQVTARMCCKFWDNSGVIRKF